uniref:Uncharacterized protein n=1 Tax=Moorena producens (strain JHB) TaxID=1454205 RepID=A0A1D9G301_MOOP1
MMLKSLLGMALRVTNVLLKSNYFSQSGHNRFGRLFRMISYGRAKTSLINSSGFGTDQENYVIRLGIGYVIGNWDSIVLLNSIRTYSAILAELRWRKFD